MNYAVQQRLRLIDLMLGHFGYAGPQQISDYFGISRPAASLDFTKYNELNPGNAYYNHSTLCWIASDDFKRAYP